MSHGPTKIASKGACIYCGRTGLELTDEHVVPLSLGGQHIIRDASCLDCAKITTRFERDVARELWGDARVSYDAPSRRKRMRKTHIVLTDPDMPHRKVEVPYSEYPAPIVFYRMQKAGILQGLPDTLDISDAWQLVAISDDKKSKEFKQKFGVDLTAKFRNVPDSFARLIAKTGYCHVLMSLDPGDFRPLCLPYILGQKKNLSYIVGGKFNTTEPEDKGYVLGTVGFASADRMMIIAEVRLYANLQTPIYHVLVGDVRGQASVAAVLKKLGEIQLTVITPSLPSDTKTLEGDHCMPSVWPLPFWRT
jgi:hypothetical protein